MGKRKTRRQRHFVKAVLRALDKKAEEVIRGRMLWSMATWGGRKCPDCGLRVRPHWLIEKDYCGPLTIDNKVVGRIDAFGAPCEYVKNCQGPKDWC